jgi:probable HAF family extracellular repeat protein
MKRSILLGYIAFLLLISIARAAEFNGFGPLLRASSAFGVSGDGTTAVGYATNSACYRMSNGQIVTLENLPGGSSGAAYGVSLDGSVIVGYGSSTSGTQAVRWANGVATGLGDFSGGSFESKATGVSSNGSVVVGYGTNESGCEAFRWTASGGMMGLGDLPGNPMQLGAPLNSRANDVSGDGSVVVGYGNSYSGTEAFRWSGGTMSGLGDLAGGSFLSVANAVSANGSTIVGYGMSASGHEAFRWTSAGGMVGLGDLSGGQFYSEAMGTSGDGSIVIGASRTGAQQYEAFLWTESGGMRNLKDLLEADLHLDLTGWVLTSATDISDDGLTIVGYGVHNGSPEEGWVATIPEPGTVVLLGGGLLLARRRIQKRI